MNRHRHFQDFGNVKKVPVTCRYWSEGRCFHPAERCSYLHGYLCRYDGDCESRVCGYIHLKQKEKSHLSRSRPRRHSRSYSRTPSPRYPKIRYRSRTPSRGRRNASSSSRSPSRLRSRSRSRYRSKSRSRHRSRSLSRYGSSTRKYSRSPARSQNRSSSRLKSRSPTRLRRKSPVRNKSRSSVEGSIASRRDESMSPDSYLEITLERARNNREGQRRRRSSSSSSIMEIKSTRGENEEDTLPSEVIHIDCDDTIPSSLPKEKEDAQESQQKQIMSDLMKPETQALLQSILKLTSKERQDSPSPDPVITEKMLEEIALDLEEVGEEVDDYFGETEITSSKATTNRDILLDKNKHGQGIRKDEPAVNPSPPEANCSKAQHSTERDWQPSSSSLFKPPPVKDPGWNVGRSSMWTPSLDRRKPTNPDANITYSGNSSWEIETPYVSRNPDVEPFLVDSVVKKSAALLSTAVNSENQASSITPGLHHSGRSTIEELSPFQQLLKTFAGNSAAKKGVLEDSESLLMRMATSTENTAARRDYGENSKNSNKASNSGNRVETVLLEDSSSNSDVDAQCSERNNLILDEKEDSVEKIETLRVKMESISKKIEHLEEQKFMLKGQRETIIKNHKGNNKRDLLEETDYLIDEIGKQIVKLKNMLHENRMKILSGMKESSGGIGKSLEFFQRTIRSPEYTEDRSSRLSDEKHGDSSSPELPLRYSRSVELSQPKSSPPSQTERHRKSSRSFSKDARTPKRSRSDAISPKSSHKWSKSQLSSKMKRPLSPAPKPVSLKIDGQHWSRSHIQGTLKKLKNDLLSKNDNAGKGNAEYSESKNHDLNVTEAGSAESSSQLLDNKSRKTSHKNINENYHDDIERSPRGLDSEEKERKIKHSSVTESKKPIRYVDLGMHWCKLCDVIFDTIPTYCKHLLSSAHLARSKNDSKPWLAKIPKTFQKPVVGGSNFTTLPVVGSEFYHSLSVIYCSLCDTFLREMGDSLKHLESEEHTVNYKTYKALNPEKYEAYIKAHSSALSRYNYSEGKKNMKNYNTNERKTLQIEDRLLREIKNKRGRKMRQIKDGNEQNVEDLKGTACGYSGNSFEGLESDGSKLDRDEKQAKSELHPNLENPISSQNNETLGEEENPKSDEKSSEQDDDDSEEDLRKSIELRKAFNMIANKKFLEREMSMKSKKDVLSKAKTRDSKMDDKLRDNKTLVKIGVSKSPEKINETRDIQSIENIKDVKSPHETGDKSRDKMRDSKSQDEMVHSNLDKTIESKSTLKFPLVGKMPFFKKKGALCSAKTPHKGQGIKDAVVLQSASIKNMEDAQALSEINAADVAKKKDFDSAICEIENYLRESDRMDVKVSQENKTGKEGLLDNSNKVNDRESERLDGKKTYNRKDNKSEKLSLSAEENKETNCKSQEALLDVEKESEMVDFGLKSGQIFSKALSEAEAPKKEDFTEDPSLATLEALQLLNIPLPGLELPPKCPSVSSSNTSAKTEEGNGKEFCKIPLPSSGPDVPNLKEEFSVHSSSKHSSDKQSDRFLFFPATGHSLDVSSPYELGCNDSVPDFTFCKRDATPPPPGTENIVLESICLKEESHCDHVDRLTPPPPGTEIPEMGNKLNRSVGLQMQGTFANEPPSSKQMSVSDTELLRNNSCVKTRVSLTTEEEMPNKRRYPNNENLGSDKVVSEKPEIDENVVKSCGVEHVIGNISLSLKKEKTENILENTNRNEGNKSQAVVEKYDHSAVKNECKVNNTSQDKKDFEITDYFEEAPFEHMPEKCQAIEFKAFHINDATGICNINTKSTEELVCSNDSLTSIDSENICLPSFHDTSLKQMDFTVDSSEDDLPSLSDSPSRTDVIHSGEINVDEDKGKEDVKGGENEGTEIEKSRPGKPVFSDKEQVKQEKYLELKLHRITRSESSINAKAFVNNAALDIKDKINEDLSHNKNGSTKKKQGGKSENKVPYRRSLRTAKSVSGREKETETSVTDSPDKQKCLPAHSNDTQTPVKKTCSVNPPDHQEFPQGMSTPGRSSRKAAVAATLAMSAQIKELIKSPSSSSPSLKNNSTEQE